VLDVNRYALALALFLSGSTGMAAAERLELVAALEDGSDLYIDTDTLRKLAPVRGERPFPVTQVWAFYDLSKNRREKAREARALVSFNCAARTHNVLAFKKTLPTGQRQHDWRAIDYDFKYEKIEPEGQMDILLHRVCNLPYPRPATPEPYSQNGLIRVQ
jgi:hypothetical protein